MICRPLYSVRISFIIIAFFLVINAHQAHKPFILDNMDFPAVAEATKQSGIPIYYRGEENSKHSGLYHPPLYIYILAGWFKLFGFGEAQTRMFGALCAVLQGFIVILISRTVFGQGTVKKIEPYFWLFFLLNPYTLQTSSIADIDSTIYGPILCFILLLTLRISWRDGEWRKDSPGVGEFLAVAAGLSLGFWAKLTTVLLMPPFIFLLFILRFRWQMALLWSLVLTLIGFGAFIVSYLLYGWIFELDILYSFKFLLFSFLSRGSYGRFSLSSRLFDYAHNLGKMVPFTVKWTGLVPWLVLFGLLGTLFVPAYWGRNRRAIHLQIILLLGLICTVYYCAQVTSFGNSPFKYIFVYWGILQLPVVFLASGTWNCFIGEGLQDIGGQTATSGKLIKPFAWICFLLMGFVLGLSCLKDRLIWTGDFRANWSYIVIPVLVFGGMACVLFLLGGKWRNIAPVFLIMLTAFFGGLQAGVAVFQSQAEYSTTYNYGQTGIRDAAAFIELNTTSDDIIVSMKDLGFLSRRRYFENYIGLYGDTASAERLIDAIRSGRAKYAIFTEGIGEDQLIVNPKIMKWMQESCNLVAEFGNYRIYVYKDENK